MQRLVTTLLLAQLAACTGGQTGDEDALGDESGMDLPGMDALAVLAAEAGASNYEAADSIRDLAQRSDRIVIARATGIEVGRTFVPRSGRAEGALETVVMELSVLEAIKSDTSTLYLEFIVGDAEAILPLSLPSERVLVFASEAQRESLFVGGSIDNAGRGLPAGATLYQLTTPQGMIVDRFAGPESAFERGDPILADRDFDELVAQASGEGAPSAGAMGGVVQGGAAGAASTGEPAPDAGTSADATQETSDAGAGVVTDGATESALCELPFDSGPCLASMPVYTFDLAMGACVEAIYGGCQGNANRFDTLQACEAACGDSSTQCPAGLQLSEVCLACGLGGGCIEMERRCARTCMTGADCAADDLSTQCWQGLCQVGGCI